MKLKLKDIYLSVQQGKDLKRIKERKKNKILKKQALSEDTLNEWSILNWMDKFFEKVKKNQADEIIRNLKKNEPNAAEALLKIKQGVEEISHLAKTDTTKEFQTNIFKALFN